jgi:hypothetical protein
MREKSKLVDVLGKIYKVKFLKDKKFEEQEFGIFFPDDQEIWINLEKGIDHRKDSVIHEILHAVSYDLNLKLNENQVRHLGCAIFQVLRTNQKIRQWLFSNRKKVGE